MNQRSQRRMMNSYDTPGGIIHSACKHFKLTLAVLAAVFGCVQIDSLLGQAAGNITNDINTAEKSIALTDIKESNDLIRGYQQVVNGVVTDAETGNPLPGVNVIVAGSDELTGSVIGTQTDFDGTYSLDIPDELNILVFSYVGFQRLEVDIDGRAEIDVALRQDIAMLEEAVVVGFGTQERVNLSGAVDQIDVRQLDGRSISNITQGLQGMIPNLNIDYLEGAPGTEPEINIRGFTSINEGDPLIIIDGIPSEMRDLTRLDPQDVQSISVLKDASSAAIYGARAAFGVVLIETKRGTREGINVSLSSRASWDRPTVLPDKTTDPYIYMRWQDMSTSATPWDYINYTEDEYEWARQRSDNPGGTQAVREDPNNPGQWQYMGNRDWTRYFLSDYGMSANNTLSIDGRTESTSFYLSGSYDRQDGALQLSDDHFDRWGVRSNVEYRPYEWITIGNNSYISSSNRVMPSRMGSDTWSMWEFYNHAPMAMDQNPDGSWANTTVGTLASQLTEGGDLEDSRELYQTSFNASTELIEQMLTVNADYTIRREFRNYNYDQRRYSLGYGPEDIREFGSTLVYRNRTTYDYQIFNVYSNLHLDFDRHQINTLAGFNQEKNEMYEVIAEVPNVISSDLPSLSLSLGDPNTTDLYEGWAVRGIFGRVNYTYDNRYILEFNGRYDGSSRFPSAARYGFFPSGSVAWRIDQESFMEQFEWLDMLKVRGSYGALGNQSVAPFGHIPTMSAYRANYIVGDSRPLSISSPALVSPNYRWEEVFTTNYGLDIDLLESRIMISLDRYTRETTGMLTLGRELPAVLGAQEPSENAADLETKGWELSLRYRDHFEVFGSDLSFGTRFTLADSRTWITKFDNPENFLNQYYEGQEIGEIWGLQFEGLFETEEEVANHADQSEIVPWGVLPVIPGWPKFRDTNGDGQITVGDTVDEPGDISVIGNSQPRYRFGLNIDMAWRNFDFRAFFQGIGKRDYYPQHYLFWGFYQQPYEGGYEHLLDFYRAEDDPQSMMDQHSQAYIDAGLANANTNAKYPVLQAWLMDVNTFGIGQVPNDGYMLDASYLRLKNLTIGYTLPRSLTAGIGIQDLRIYLSGENLAEWSEVSDFVDPETITDDAYGYRYPFQRRFSIGINVNF
jgi:TonB-linked SusC/RagA family outer membrane protein